jgi:hypothetical protein
VRSAPPVRGAAQLRLARLLRGTRLLCVLLQVRTSVPAYGSLAALGGAGGAGALALC